MDEQVDGLSTVEMCDKPSESGQDGVWETTQLDSAIGDLQRGLIDCSLPREYSRFQKRSFAVPFIPRNHAIPYLFIVNKIFRSHLLLDRKL